MNMSEFRVTKRVVPQVNVTPLIDVLLVLLIIFMILSPLKLTRFKVLIPQPPKESTSRSAGLLVVTLDNNLRLGLNDQQNVATIQNMGPLTERLAALLSTRDSNVVAQGNGSSTSRAAPLKKTVFLRAPRSLPYGPVAKVVDALKGAGADPIGLQIDSLP